MSTHTIDAGAGWTIEGSALVNNENCYDLFRSDLLAEEDGIYMWIRAVGAKTWSSHQTFLAAWLLACNHFGLPIDWDVLARTVENIRDIKAAGARV